MTPIDLSLRAGVHGAVSARRALLGGREVVLAQCDPSVRRGALTPADGDTMADAARHAAASRLPLVLTIASSGADVTEGLAASFGWGRAARAITACSGVVPVLMAAHGPAVSGPALLLGLADHVVMTTDAYAFVSGPQMVHQITDVVVDTGELGGAAVHASATGLAALVVPDLDAALDVIGTLLSFLPSHVDELPPHIRVDDPPDRPTPELRDTIPSSSSGSYDVRDVITAIVDYGALVELRAGWARNLVTAQATVDRHPVGVVANQPQSIAGTLDIPASQKGARFVSFCDAFNLPLVTLVDTSGFYPGKDLEWRGMIRHGAQLAFASIAEDICDRESFALKQKRNLKRKADLSEGSETLISMRFVGRQSSERGARSRICPRPRSFSLRFAIAFISRRAEEAIACPSTPKRRSGSPSGTRTIGRSPSECTSISIADHRWWVPGSERQRSPSKNC